LPDLINFIKEPKLLKKEMRELIFVTNNRHKLSEIRQIAGSGFTIKSLAEIGFSGEIEETEETLEGNALLKARYIHKRFGCNCFADDTGLEVDALGGAPGVFSARYAGEDASYSDNVNKLLDALSGETNRKARFRTVIALIQNNREYLFEGSVEGTILEKPHGNAGFGYDPVFSPDGTSLAFAEMDSEDKNRISHRGRATEALIRFLATNGQ
jgi:XTP/dITP diphosphohydrolase